MPLALESEWGDQEAVDRDFQKMQAVRLLDDGTRKLDEAPNQARRRLMTMRGLVIATTEVGGRNL
jgi:hypothetical protein